jgi:hypothetical protein
LTAREPLQSVLEKALKLLLLSWRELFIRVAPFIPTALIDYAVAFYECLSIVTM